VFTPNIAPQWAWFGSATAGDSGSFKANHPADWNNGYDHEMMRSQIEPVGGVSVHGDLSYKSFSMSANYVSAIADMISDSINYVSSGNNRTRMWGADVNADYSFKTFKRNSSLGASIQWSGNGAWMGDNNAGRTDWLRIIPRWRLVGEYKVNLFKNTDLSLIVAHGKSYEFKTTASPGDFCAEDYCATKYPTRGYTDPEDGSSKTILLGLASLNIQF